MKKKKHSKKNVPNEERTFHNKKEKGTNPAPEKQIGDEYFYNKKGDGLLIFFYGLFAFIFFLPGISVSFGGNEPVGGLICLAIALIPTRYLVRELYSKKVLITRTSVRFTHTAAFKKTISWEVPLSKYSHISKYLSSDDSVAMLWHSSDDSKNVILYSVFYKYDEEVYEAMRDLDRFFRGTDLGKHKDELKIRIAPDYQEKNFFEIYNSTKTSRNWRQLLFPDRHVKILKDESTCFLVAVNKGLKFFLGGLACFALSFAVLPIVYKIGGVASWCVLLHLAGILLYNFGVSEQILKVEKRSVVIGNRYFKKKIRGTFSIPIADITAVEVLRHAHDGKDENAFLLRVTTKNNFYEFGRCPQEAELQWLADVLTDRMTRINNQFNYSIRRHENV